MRSVPDCNRKPARPEKIRILSTIDRSANSSTPPTALARESPSSSILKRPVNSLCGKPARSNARRKFNPETAPRAAARYRGPSASNWPSSWTRPAPPTKSVCTVRSATVPLRCNGPLYSPRNGSPGYDRATVVAESGNAAAVRSNAILPSPTVMRPLPLKREAGAVSPSRCVRSTS